MEQQEDQGRERFDTEGEELIFGTNQRTKGRP